MNYKVEDIESKLIDLTDKNPKEAFEIFEIIMSSVTAINNVKIIFES